MKQLFKQRAICMAIACLPGLTLAQTPPGTEPAQPQPSGTPSASAAAPQQASELQTVVITGTGLRRAKLEAPFAISTLSDAAIRASNPASSNDLLKTIPGFAAEPSAGQGGNQNLQVRGLPFGGYYVVQLQEDGLTLFDEQQESFLNIDSLYSIDLMTQRVEVVRGGTSPIFATNASGGTVNLITRRGGSVQEGEAKLTVGNRGFVRTDAYVSGPLSETVRYAVGGFTRRSDGFRPTGYTADQGGQLRGSLSFLLGNARLDLDAKYLNDRTAFYTPIPLADPRNPSQSLQGLIDPGTGTMLSNDFRSTLRKTFYGNDAITERRNLADGLHSRVMSTGAHFQWSGPQGLNISNRLRFLDAEVNVDAVFSGAPPADANAYLNSALTRARAGFGSAVSRVGFRTVSDGQAFDPATTAGLVIESGLWTIKTKVKTTTNDFRVSKEADWGSLTGGLHLSHFEFEQDRLQNTILTNLKSQPSLLDVVAFDATGKVLGRVTDNGFVRYGSGVTRGRAAGDFVSPYLTGALRFGPLGVDAGARFTRFSASGGVYANGNRDLGDASTLADDNVGGLTGAFRERSDVRKVLQKTIGAEYKLDTRTQLFARYTESQRLPRLQNVYQTANNDKQSFVQAEIGWRGVRDTFDFGLVGFYSRFDDFTTTLTGVLNQATGNFETLSLAGKTLSTGLEAEFNWRPVPFFSLSGTMTLQDPKSSDLVNRNTGQRVAAADGKLIPRSPRWILTAQPTFHFNLSDTPMRLSLEYYHVDKRYVDFTNSTALPAFKTLDLNVSADLGSHWTLVAQVTNLTNETGLTEGNPRTDIVSGQGTANAIYARPILGRSFSLSLGYSW